MVRNWWKRCAAGGSAVVFAVFVVGAAGAATTTFTSSDGPVTINDYSSGPTVASPSPSVINVGPGFGTVAKATVTLHGLTHTWPADLNVLLVAPNGSSVVLMAQTGAGSAPSGDVTFDDAAALSYSDSAGGDPAGTWRPAQAPSQRCARELQLDWVARESGSSGTVRLHPGKRCRRPRNRSVAAVHRRWMR